MLPTIGNTGKRCQMQDIVRSESCDHIFHCLFIKEIYLLKGHSQCRRIVLHGKFRRIDIYAKHLIGQIIFYKII